MLKEKQKNRGPVKFFPLVGVIHQPEILKKVIFLKKEIERIREQVQNIE
jgi:hypothetical protein